MSSYFVLGAMKIFTFDESVVEFDKVNLSRVDLEPANISRANLDSAS